MKKAIELIENWIAEHEMSCYCTDYDKAETTLKTDAEQGFNMAYDVGRYETLVNLLIELEELEDQNNEKTRTNWRIK